MCEDEINEMYKLDEKLSRFLLLLTCHELLLLNLIMIILVKNINILSNMKIFLQIK